LLRRAGPSGEAEGPARDSQRCFVRQTVQVIDALLMSWALSDSVALIDLKLPAQSPAV